MKASPVIVIAGLAMLLAASTAMAADLASAKALYASASYEEALTALAGLESTANVEEVNELRALCLLALGRTGEAEKAVTRIVLHNPSYTLDPVRVSPKLVKLFTEVRRRTLPVVARELYERAKSNYDDQRWADAKRAFADLMAVLKDPGLAGHESLTDLRQLSEGFLKLTEEEYAAAVANGTLRFPEPAGVARPGLVDGLDAELVPVIPVIYSSLDRMVKPPVEQRSVMPRWTPPNRTVALLNAKGLLEIIVDDTGRVERATMLRPTTPSYDNPLVEVARSWKYDPAIKDGQPVYYRLVIEIVLNPGQ